MSCSRCALPRGPRSSAPKMPWPAAAPSSSCRACTPRRLSRHFPRHLPALSRAATWRRPRSQAPGPITMAGSRSRVRNSLACNALAAPPGLPAQRARGCLPVWENRRAGRTAHARRPALAAGNACREQARPGNASSMQWPILPGDAALVLPRFGPPPFSALLRPSPPCPVPSQATGCATGAAGSSSCAGTRFRFPKERAPSRTAPSTSSRA